MYVRETNSRDTFLKNRPPGVPVRVVRMATVQAVRRAGTVRMVPAVELTYSFATIADQWVYREVRLADERGRTDLSDTLWAELERQGNNGYELLHRSGSF